MTTWIVTAAVSGFLAVALGAFGAHGLRDALDQRGQDLWQKAVLYQMFHTLALLAIGLLQGQHPEWRLHVSGVAFAAGIVVFSGSLYLLALGAPRWFGAITPVGGTAFLLGWAWLAWTVLRAP
jgi:uncharacterized membrane protein YgdD (TMEM256/DUF423 family)